MVERLILATDMSRHAHFSAALRADIDAGRSLPAAGEGAAGAEERLGLMEGAEERLGLMELLIKAADASNVLRPFPVAKRWAVRLTHTHTHTHTHRW